METVTLKLTKSESNTLFETSMDKEEIGLEIDLTDVKVYDVDKFREFLNDEINAIPTHINNNHITNKSKVEMYTEDEIRYNNLKSILSKLDKEAK